MDNDDIHIGMCCHYATPVVRAFSESRYVIGEVHGRSEAYEWLRQWNLQRKKPLLSDSTLVSIWHFIRRPRIADWRAECPTCALKKAEKEYNICVDRILHLVNYLISLRNLLESAGMKTTVADITKALEEFGSPIKGKGEQA